MTGEITIRPIEERDQTQWRPLWDGYNAFYGRAGPTALPEQVTGTIWARFFNPDEPVHALAAEIEGRLVGITHYLFHRRTSAIEPICYLSDLFTAPAARGAGVGRAVIEGVSERAWAAGATSVYWQTHETNLTAMKLYDKVADRSGFLVYRRVLR
jgi:GNAT superfamily N-acetyltransferase